jgi:hypothetical protein
MKKPLAIMLAVLGIGRQPIRWVCKEMTTRRTMILAIAVATTAVLLGGLCLSEVVRYPRIARSAYLRHPLLLVAAGWSRLFPGSGAAETVVLAGTCRMIAGLVISIGPVLVLIGTGLQLIAFSPGKPYIDIGLGLNTLLWSAMATLVLTPLGVVTIVASRRGRNNTDIEQRHPGDSVPAGRGHRVA